MKRLLILGGSDTIIPYIKKAREMGCYVITCDNRPDDPGNQFSHEYHNVSILDQEGVLRLAESLKIDGITVFNYDPGAQTAAYVAEKLGLPTNPYRTVETLTRKDLFRAFLSQHGFLTPAAKAVKTYEEAVHFQKDLGKTCIIKPVDTWGSKGVYKVGINEDFRAQFEDAFQYSQAGIVIIEEFINKKGFQIGGDGFLVDGNLVFRCFGDARFIPGFHLKPVLSSYPTQHPERIIQKVHDSLQQVLWAAGMKMGAFNIDIIVDEEDQVYILDIGPRNGGNMIPEIIQYCTGVDLIEYTIKAALGLDCTGLRLTHERKYIGYFLIFARQAGTFRRINKSNYLESKILREELYIKEGETVTLHSGLATRLGILLLKYDTKEEIQDIFDNMDKHVEVIID
jgi:biotin carboxylase